MTIYTLRSNLDRGTQVLVPDLGFYVPASGGTVAFNDDGNIQEIQGSLLTGSLAVLTDDNAFVGGTDPSDETLILDIDGTDVPPGDGGRIVAAVPLTIEEQDGSPSVLGVSKIKVPNGALTDDGNGTISLDFGASDYAGRFEGLTIGTGDISLNKWGWWYDTTNSRLVLVRNRAGTLFGVEANPL